MADLRRVAAGVLAIAGLAATAGCSEDDPALLEDDALPAAVESSSDGHAGFPGISGCSELVDQQSFAGTDAWAADGYGYWTWTLDSGDAVHAAVLDFRDADQRAASVERITAAIEECSTTDSDLEVTALEGLPEDRFGYFASEPVDDTTKQGTLVFAPASGDRLVAVGVSRRDGQEPEADVMDLLDTAVERATDLDGLPSKADDGE